MTEVMQHKAVHTQANCAGTEMHTQTLHTMMVKEKA